MAYRFLEDEAIADIAFEASALNIHGLFESCALAVEEVMVELRSVRPVNEKIIRIKESSYADLLLKFLEEIVFIKDAENLIFSKFSINIKKEKENLLFLEAKCSGEEIDRERHKLKTDVKAITYHHFKLWREKGKWKARVLVDV